MAGCERRRILVVEDEGLIALMIEDMLLDLGYEVAGPAATLDEAMVLIRAQPPIHAAVLDLNICGEPVFPVVDALRARGVPVIMTTGYGDDRLRADDRHGPVLHKPFVEAELIAALARAFGEGSETPPG